MMTMAGKCAFPGFFAPVIHDAIHLCIFFLCFFLLSGTIQATGYGARERPVQTYAPEDAMWNFDLLKFTTRMKGPSPDSNSFLGHFYDFQIRAGHKGCRSYVIHGFWNYNLRQFLTIGKCDRAYSDNRMAVDRFWNSQLACWSRRDRHWRHIGFAFGHAPLLHLGIFNDHTLFDNRIIVRIFTDLKSLRRFVRVYGTCAYDRPDHTTNHVCTQTFHSTHFSVFSALDVCTYTPLAQKKSGVPCSPLNATNYTKSPHQQSRMTSAEPTGSDLIATVDCHSRFSLS